MNSYKDVLGVFCDQSYARFASLVDETKNFEILQTV